MTDYLSILQRETIVDREHADPSIHYIGEALPVPAASEAKNTGAASTVGVSPNPARADHSHDLAQRFGIYHSTSTGLSCNGNTATFMNDLSIIAGENYFHTGSTQIIDVPQEGCWQVRWEGSITRVGAFTPNGLFEVAVAFNNATSIRNLDRWWGPTDIPAGMPLQYFEVTCTGYFTTIAASSNIQLRFNNNDTSGLTFTVRTLFLDIRRLCSAQGAEVA